MAASTLTRKIVEGLKGREREYVVWHDKTIGFGCRVQPKGSRSFIVQYRMTPGAPLRKVTIGRYEGDGGEWSFDDAHTKAFDIINNKHQRTKDEAAERKRKREEMTVAQLCDDYIEHGCDHKRPSTLATDKASLNNHVKPLLGSKRVSDITKRDLQNFTRAVERGDTQTTIKTKDGERFIVRGGAGVARRTLRVVSAMFTYAKHEGFREAHPRDGLKIGKDNEAERYLGADDIERLGNAMDEALEPGLPWKMREGVAMKYRAKDAANRREKLSVHAVAAIRLLLATGMRCGEVLSLEWQHVDLDNGFIYIPKEKSKTGSKAGNKVVVLSDVARAILIDLRDKHRTKGFAYVIEGEAADKPRSDLKRPWARISEHAGISFRLHDLRHTFASHAAMSGVGLPLVAKLLGHRQLSTTARYTHFADFAERAAANAVANQLAERMASKASNVVPIGRSAA